MPVNIDVVFEPNSDPNRIFADLNLQNLVRRAADAWESFLGEPSPTRVEKGTIFNFAPPKGSSFKPNAQWYQPSITEQTGFNGIRIYVTETNFAPSNSSTTGQGGALVGKFAPNQKDKNIDYEYENVRLNGIKFLPSAGQIFFNSKAKDEFIGNNLIYLTALHEIGHALGFYPSYATKSRTPDPFLGIFGGSTFKGNNFTGDIVNDDGGFHFTEVLRSKVFADTRTDPFSNASTDSQIDLLNPKIGKDDVASLGITDNDIKFLADIDTLSSLVLD